MAEAAVLRTATGDEAPAAGSRQRRRRVPAALRALLAATALLGLAWALLTPAMQAPDENAHTGYLQSLAEDLKLPGDPALPLFSTEQSAAAAASNSDQTAAVLETRPEWDRGAYERWREQDLALPAAQRVDGGGPNPAASNPPLYYIFASAAWRAASAGDFYDRLLAARLVGVLFLLLTVVAVWLLAGEVVGRRPVLQLAAAGVAGLAPMMTFVSGSVTPDSLLFALWSLFLWLGVRALKRGMSVRDALALFAVVGLACIVKSTSYALVPAALGVLAITLWRHRGEGSRHVLAVAAGAVAGLLLTAGGWYAIARGISRPLAPQITAATAAQAGLNVRELGSYVWQFYLPRLPFQQDFFPATSGPRFYEVWIKGAWAAFGWLEVKFPAPVYALLAGVTALVTAMAAARLWITRRSSDLAVGAFLALVTVSLLAGLHWSEYRISTGGFNQGRYILPLVGIAGLAVAQAIRLLPDRRQAWGAAAVLAGLYALQIFSLQIVAERFFA